MVCNGVENVNEFCYLGNRLSSSGIREAAGTIRARLGWIKLAEWE